MIYPQLDENEEEEFTLISENKDVGEIISLISNGFAYFFF
jgi:hypothetical protein